MSVIPSFVMPSRHVTRVAAIAASLTLALVAAIVPAARPAEATILPDLAALTGSTSITVKHGGAFTHIFYVKNIGAGVAPVGTIVATTLPPGSIVDTVSYVAPSFWKCGTSGTTVRCTSQTRIEGGEDPIRVRVDAHAPGTAGTYGFDSVADPDHLVLETNENNNVLHTTLTVTP